MSSYFGFRISRCRLHVALILEYIWNIYGKSLFLDKMIELKLEWSRISQGRGNLRRWCNNNYFKKHGNDPLALASSYWDWMNIKDSYAFLVIGFDFRFQVQYRIMQQFIKKLTQAIMITANRQCCFRKSPMTMKVPLM